jgi:putative hydrolase of the HAD superfamily
MNITRIKNWIFDLDNTLYSARDGVFGQIKARMALFVANHLDLHLDDARRVQTNLFHRYGTTLRGMMVEHQIDPVTFMKFVHDVDLSAMPINPNLVTAIKALPGQKIIYTNASRFHAERVLRHLTLADEFGHIFDIMAADFVPKPNPAPYQQLLTQQTIDPHSAVMVEDMVENLHPAKQCGMTTIWIDEESSSDTTPDFVDHRINNLSDFLHRILAA